MDPTTVAVVAQIGQIIKENKEPIVAFLKTAFGPAFKQGGLMLGDLTEEQRLIQRWDIVKRLKLRADAMKVKIHEVPGTTLLQLLEAQDYENDDFMRDTWANLLYRAATAEEEEVPRSFVATLKDLGPREVKLLNGMFSEQEKHPGFAPLSMEMIRHIAASSGLNHAPSRVPDYDDEPARAKYQAQANRDEHFLGVTIGILMSRQLIAEDLKESLSKLALQMSNSYGGQLYGHPMVEVRYALTNVARQFVSACRPPQKPPDGNA